MREVKVTEVPQGAQLIDVREAHEYAAGHAAGAVNIPTSVLPARMNEVDKTQDVYLICQLGGRSAKATALLAEHGYLAINVSGGTDSWIQAGLPTE